MKDEKDEKDESNVTVEYLDVTGDEETTTTTSTTVTTSTGENLVFNSTSDFTVDVTGNSGLTYSGDYSTGFNGYNTITLPNSTSGYSNNDGTWNWGPILNEASKEELQKIIKNQEVQIEINGEMKTCKLADLLNTGYLTLKSI